MQNNITEGNKLIAEFMGWTEMSHTKSKNWMLSELIDGEPCAKKECSLPQMKFYTSWDWLMPVWVKCREWCWNNTGYNEFFDAFERRFMMGVFNGYCESSCKTVVEFIQWYNTNNTK